MKPMLTENCKLNTNYFFGNGAKRGSNQYSVISIQCRAFTLIEIMIVVAIIAIIMTIGVPFMRNALEGKKGMSGAVKSIQEACSHARAVAIMQQQETELRIRPGAGTFEVGAASGQSAEHSRLESTDIHGEEWRMQDRKPGGSSGGGGSFSTKLPEGIRIEGLGVNGEDWTEDELARVKFYPNGTCDEMSVVLVSDTNERRNVWLEVVTGFAEVESDPYKFKAR
jgi:prepilin-type N-terminal cleavage/methylation domain-containing protein